MQKKIRRNETVKNDIFIEISIIGDKKRYYLKFSVDYFLKQIKRQLSAETEEFLQVIY